MLKEIESLERSLIEEFRKPADDFIKGDNPWLEFRSDGRRVVIDKIGYVEEIPIDIFKDWIKKVGKASLYILFTNGKFNSDIITYALTEKEIQNKVILVPIDLDKNKEIGIKPLVYDFSSNKNTLLSSVFNKSGIPFRNAHCTACNKTILGACTDCGQLLCKDHFISCAICKKLFCHPDLVDRECFYKHNCKKTLTLKKS